MQLTQAQLNQLRERGKRSLFFLTKAILGFHDLETNIHKPACDTLQDYINNTRAIIVFPRTWFKSTMASISYAIWRSINDPNVRILVVQNSFSNAVKKLASIRSIFEKNQLFRALYPEILPTSDCTWKAECLTVNRTKSHPEGTFEAAGVGTATTSRHYDLILQDDTVSPKKDDMTGVVQQPTKADIEKAIGWHKLCYPLLLHPKKSQIIIIGTRWAERDLIGYVKEYYPEFKVLTRAISEDEDGNPKTLLDGGKLTWPSRFDKEVYEELERAEGPYMFASLYLNSPTSAVNQVFKREWIHYYSSRPKDCIYCTSVDLAAASLEESSDPDFNVILTTAFSPFHNAAFVVEYTRRRMSPSDVIDCIFEHYDKYHPVTVKVDAIAYQRTLVHWLKKKQRKLNKLFYVEAVTSLKGSKEERIRGLQPYLADGIVKIRVGMDELEKELLAFPKGAHDDIIDALHLHRGFWNEMAELNRQEKAEKAGEDIFSGDAVIKELTGRFQDIRTYPYDMGNLADKYLMEIQFTRPDLYERVRDSAELVRVRGNRALIRDLVLQGV